LISGKIVKEDVQKHQQQKKNKTRCWTGIDHQDYTGKRGDDTFHVDGLVLQETSIGIVIVPVRGFGQNSEATGKSGQMSGETLSVGVIAQRSNLINKIHNREREKDRN
jgi:hypothetical protein